jgi:single-strand DNA-binding protein
MSNAFSFIGRLGADAETRKTQGGTSVLSFRAANDVGVGDKKTTQWITCLIFGKRAEGRLVEFLTKGAQVFVTGELRAALSEGQNKTYMNLDLFVDRLDLVGGRQQIESPAAAPQPKREAFEPDQDIPF